MRYNTTNFHTLLRIMYEFTGNNFYLRNDIKPCLNWFHQLRKEIKEMISNGEICRYNLINLATKENRPFSVNKIQL